MPKKQYIAKKQIQMGRKEKQDGKSGENVIINAGETFNLDSTKDKELIKFLIDRESIEVYTPPEAPKQAQDLE